MKRRLLLLAGGIAILWLLLSYPAHLLDSETGLLYSAVAAVLCVVPTLATLVWCDLVMGGAPEQQLMAVFGGTSIRIVFVIGIGMVLYQGVREFHAGRFWLWIIGFYLATLALEMVLIVRRQAVLDKASGPSPPV